MKTTATYRGFQIAIKRDWGRYGFWDSTQRRNRKRGVVVTNLPPTYGNAIPGAGWFLTVREACIGIDALWNVGLGADDMRELTLDQQIARETDRAQAWYREYDRLSGRLNVKLEGDTLKAALAD